MLIRLKAKAKLVDPAEVIDQSTNDKHTGISSGISWYPTRNPTGFGYQMERDRLIN